jgi:hypothetical protein
MPLLDIEAPRSLPLVRIGYNRGMSIAESALERLLRPSEGDIPPEFARCLLALDFSPADHTCYHELSEKAQAGTLTPDESEALTDLLTANDVLTILRAKARPSLAGSSAQ